MAFPDEPAAQERAMVSLVTRLNADGDTAPLIALLQDGAEGPNASATC